METISRFRKSGFVLTMAAVLFCVTPADVAAQSPARVIPSFQFYQNDIAVFTEKNLSKGKPHFFVFFDTGCDHCQHAMEYLNGHYSDFSDAAIYLVSLESIANMNAFLGKHAANLKGKKNIILLQDKKNEFITKFSPRKYPSIFLYTSSKALLMYDDDEKRLPEFSKLIRQQGKQAG
jgi:AhpC/TSA family